MCEMAVGDDAFVVVDEGEGGTEYFHAVCYLWVIIADDAPVLSLQLYGGQSYQQDQFVQNGFDCHLVVFLEVAFQRLAQFYESLVYHGLLAHHEGVAEKVVVEQI